MKVIQLESVGAVLVGTTTYPALANGGYDVDMGVDLSEIEEDEWWESLTNEEWEICINAQV